MWVVNIISCFHEFFQSCSGIAPYVVQQWQQIAKIVFTKAQLVKFMKYTSPENFCTAMVPS